MRVERRDGYRLLVGGPVPRGAAAITLGRWVSVREDHAHDDALLRHEAVHVRQYSELGAIRFLWRYVTSYLGWRLKGYPHWSAYRRIPLECEADWESRQVG